MTVAEALETYEAALTRRGIKVTLMEFAPQVMIIDRVELQDVDPQVIAELRDLAGEVGSELWMACRTRRDGPEAPPAP